MSQADVWKAVAATLRHDRNYFVEAVREMMAERRIALWFWAV